MISSAQINDHTKLQASALFERAKIQTGSKMLAYRSVAKAIGVHHEWFRKYLRGYEGQGAKEPKATVYENIRANYEAFCNRVEQENEKDELRLQALRRGPNARTEGISEKSDS